ncbi:hypothetical protein [Marinobacter salicampi]|uniref:hypothetical protein n=1 Tax=Marinobacter salicampi TaxID=435907 RepID=UPI001409840D|nr:hypothetical protein [Marinobacter salicampi]
MNHRHALPLIVITAVTAAMIGLSSAKPDCTVLPANASAQRIKIEKIKLLAEHTQDRVEIDGRSKLKDSQLDEEIRRRAYGYTSANEIEIHRSDTSVRVCLSSAQDFSQPEIGENQ